MSTQSGRRFAGYRNTSLPLVETLLKSPCKLPRVCSANLLIHNQPLYRWGESAGAISVGTHMIANGGDNEGLFRAAVMESGSPIPVGDITHGQKYYDALVKNTGCSTSVDTLACLRTVPLDTLRTEVNDAPGIFSFQVSQVR